MAKSSKFAIEPSYNTKPQGEKFREMNWAATNQKWNSTTHSVLSPNKSRAPPVPRNVAKPKAADPARQRPLSAYPIEPLVA